MYYSMSIDSLKNSASVEATGMHDFLNTDNMDIDQVDQAMKMMDKKYHTQFYSWIRNENNVDYISYYLRRVIVNYEKDNFRAIHRAIGWLVNGWSVQRTAELLIKLFYHWGVGDSKFAFLVKHITQSWPLQPALVDLVVTLVIGERSSKTARFIHQLTTGWSINQKLELTQAVATRLRWSERYFKHFLLQLSCLGDRSWEAKRGLVSSIRQSFSSRKLILQQMAPQNNTDSSKKGDRPASKALESLELVSFGTKLLKRILELEQSYPKSNLFSTAGPIPTQSPSLNVALSPNSNANPMVIGEGEGIQASPKIAETSSNGHRNGNNIDTNLGSPSPNCKMILT